MSPFLDDMFAATVRQGHPAHSPSARSPCVPTQRNPSREHTGTQQDLDAGAHHIGVAGIVYAARPRDVPDAVPFYVHHGLCRCAPSSSATLDTLDRLHPVDTGLPNVTTSSTCIDIANAAPHRPPQAPQTCLTWPKRPCMLWLSQRPGLRRSYLSTAWQMQPHNHVLNGLGYGQLPRTHFLHHFERRRTWMKIPLQHSPSSVPPQRSASIAPTLLTWPPQSHCLHHLELCRRPHLLYSELWRWRLQHVRNHEAATQYLSSEHSIDDLRAVYCNSLSS
ncbi:hypothetical protein GALMADRAFT_1145026 [Galerina marginata CBS 339.88]|uniref:Uncharacterized protein n=1 Tax=Galerina marginata (strain CBS 339.88) TaxID=685588 RepID=A0A067SIG4_GALM3|nr:hypothetical protein GALMADRAFT_1145026 [Galerina marginata CBS 339.88]